MSREWGVGEIAEMGSKRKSLGGVVSAMRDRMEGGWYDVILDVELRRIGVWEE